MQQEKPSDLRIVFFGTPGLAAFVLQATVKANKNVVAVVTAPDKPAGRGRKIRQSPVKVFALEANIPVLQPENLKSSEFLEKLASFNPDLNVVVAFRMLPESVWAMPRLGSFNLHASLLPDYRGAAPINWVIINGENESGVSTFMLDHKIDTGKILFREKIPLDTFETAGSLHEKVKVKGAELVIQTIDALASGKADPIPQKDLVSDKHTLNKAPKIYKDDCRINWNQPVETIVNHIHGLSPQPGAFTEIDQKDKKNTLLKIFSARPEKTADNPAPGTILTDNKKYLKIAGNDGLVSVLELQMEGKKRMTTEELLRGMDFLPPPQAL